MAKILTVYYKSSTLDKVSACLGNGNCYTPIYSDKECTIQTGYQYIDFIRDMIDTTNVIFIINKTFFIQNDIFRISYVKYNNEPVISPISFYNNLKNQSPLIGTVERIIFPDQVTRQLIFNFNP